MKRNDLIQELLEAFDPAFKHRHQADQLTRRLEFIRRMHLAGFDMTPIDPDHYAPQLVSADEERGM